ncbi:hypothetical protein [Caldimonas tepidiphila]|uniref:nucleotide-binding protein n=1 Tax=Caldimonas tepidiphila TaxID=2315841 RepID=UPI000E5BDAAE|nr:hypothetical protein [Caldimonas tepidiphila]
MRIAVYNEKGGAGKTTVAVMLSVLLGVPLRDLDPLATATQWLGRRQPLHSLARHDGLDWVADCPPGIEPSILPTLAAADAIVIPVRASFCDLVNLQATVRFVKSNSPARAAFVGCDIDAGEDEAMLREALAAYELPVLGMLCHRASYRRAGLSGRLASEIDASAADEAAALVEALRKLVA